MIRTLETICSLTFETNTDDTNIQLIRKLARRVYKLDLLYKNLNKVELTNEIKLLTQQTVDKCNTTIENVNGFMVKNINEIILLNSENASTILNSTILDHSSYKHKHLDKLIQEIQRLRENTKPSDMTRSSNDKDLFRVERNFSNSNNSSFHIKYMNPNDIIHLYDAEEWLFKIYLNPESQNMVTFNLNLLETYIECASSRYVNYELGRSRMILFCLVAIVMFDRRAIDKHEILREHDIGIDTKILEFLLMPTQVEISIVQSLKTYIEKRNAEAKYSSLIDTNIDPNWFGVRFVERSQSLLDIKKAIREYAEIKRNEKLKELDERRKAYYDKIALANGLDCKCEYYNANRRRVKRFKKYCEKHEYENEANSMVINVYEWPLPCDDYKQNAVVFELQIPDEIAHLRDSLYILNARILQINNNRSSWNTWLKYGELQNWQKAKQKFITLGSTTKNFACTHYNYRYLQSLPSNESIIVPNGLNIHLVEINENKLIDYDSVDKINILQKLCTFICNGKIWI